MCVVIYNNLLLNHLWNCVLKLGSELHDFIWFGIVFHRDAPENDKLVLKRSILRLGRVMNRDMARVLEQIKSCLRYGGARFLYALNTNTALLNISFSLSGSSPKNRSFVSVVKEESDIISFAALLWRELSLLNKIRYHYSRPRQLMHKLGEGKYEHGKTACA